ncbi:MULTISPECIES: hypothetical protein [Shewanella]|uniref:Tail specific protease domain-containing protein n=1 Tax=Shewanella marisflavi TaxID=260364 RepID=A0ABX5WIA6_9GAMM|nr:MULTISPECIES: hypothetical protein [Shewanella]QDF74243.1 hypothetical protein FGA12_03160 [Shewanella marisflavi]
MTFGHQSIINGFGLIMLISCIQLTAIALREEPPKPQLSQQEMRADLDYLQQHLLQYSANAAESPLRQSQLENQINKALSQLPLEGERMLFAQQLVKVLTALDDPLAEADSFQAQAYLPITLRKREDSWLALDLDHRLLNNETPFISHIDGLPIDLWLSATKAFLPPSLAESNIEQAKLLQMLSMLRREIGLAARDDCRLTLTDNQGTQHQISLALTHKPPTVLSSPQHQESFDNLPQGVFNFYDLSRFTPDSPLGQRLKRALFSPVTILDLQQGYGTGDELLKFLSHYFSPDVTPPLLSEWPDSLFAVARYKKGANLRSDFLKPLGFMPATSLNQSQRLQFELVSSLLPEDNPHFSPWQIKFWQHSSQPWAGLPQPKTGKLMLIIGPACRQQCQWIAHFARSWPNTLLVGEPTRGDFGKLQQISLPNSAIKISFNATQVYDAIGRRLSGIATQPDIIRPMDDPVYWENLIELFAPASPN